jgi:putative ABC transport system permease protein
MKPLLRDVSYAIRQLRQSPGFALTAVLILTVGIGGTVAVFSVVEAVLLRPLPFKDSGRLISLHERSELDSHELRITAPAVLLFQRENKTFSGLAGFISSAYELTGAGSPFEARAERVSASLFPALEAEPMLGRTFTQQEDENAIPVAVISFALWEERFNSDRNVLGQTIDLDRRSYTVVGVMPRNFEFPLDAGRLSHRDLWVPMSFTPVEKESEGTNFDYSAVARLKPGVTLAQAQQDVDRMISLVEVQYPADQRIGLHGYFLTLKDETVRQARPLLRILLGAVGLLLLIACVNLANLLLVRAAGRKREFGVRLALGAGRRAVLRQLVTESFLLSVFGGLAGTAVAVLLVRASIAGLPDALPRFSEIGISWATLVCAAILTGVTGLVCGVASGFESMQTNVLDSLRDGSHGSGPGRVQSRTRSALVMAEVGLAMLLLVASALLLRSFAKTLAVDPGFEPTHALTASLSLPVHDYPTQRRVNSFFAELQRRLEAVPGVKSVGFGSNIPVIGQNSGRLIAPEGYVKASGEGWIIASNYLVEGNYFEGMHIPLIRGRYFGAADDQPKAPLTVVISESLANKYFRGKDPIGMRIKVGPSFASPMPAMTIVGVVGDIKQGALDQPTVPQMYEPLSQAAADLGSFGAMIGVAGTMNVVMRTTGNPTALIGDFTQVVHQLDPLLAISHLHTMNEVIAATESSRKFNTAIITSFAAIALTLSVLGIYGTMAYSVGQRAREIAIRMAVGATPEHVLLRTLRSALAMTATGIAAGLVLSVALTKLLSSLLFNVRPLDGIAIGGAVSVLLACSTLAAWLPARRAAAIEPMRVLRLE